MIRINNWGINARVIFLAMAPVLLVILVLAVYINTARNNDLDRELAEKGQLIVTGLASALEFPVATGNLLQIQGLAEASIAKNDVVGVEVADVNGELIYKAGQDYRGDENIRRYAVEIISSAIDYEELFNQGNSNTEQQDKNIGYVEVYISNMSYHARQGNIYITTVIIAIAGLSMSVILALLIARGVTRPVRGVIDTVDALTRGELSVRMDEASGGELGKLRDGINIMAETIQNSQARLKGEVEAAVSGLEHKVHELEEKNIELDAARKEAMQAKDAKSDFLANMSHEIRTPLNAVIGFSRQLEKGGLEPRQEECTRAISRAARQLLTVIDDILSFSKLESGNMKIVTSEFRLRECLEDTILMLSQYASDKGIEMVLLIDADIPDVVLGDPDRISQVVVNLVNNAIKFTEQGSVIIHVSNELESNNDIIHFSVSDTGCGINDEVQKNLFSPFYQENQKSSKRHGGTGLGLVICKRLVEMMGGDIGFSSVPGASTEFFFTIPVVTITHHDYPLIIDDVNVYVLDQHAYSRRAIRNSLVHMGVNTFALSDLDRLLSMLDSHDPAHRHDIVMLSLAAGYPLARLDKEYLQKIRERYKGMIIILMNGDYNQAHDVTKLDDNIMVMAKPLRSSALLDVLGRRGQGTERVVHDARHEVAKAKSYFTRSILVAEDNELNQRYLMGLLSAYQVNTVCVDTGIKAVEACKNIHFDLIFMDLHMPGLDGIEATRQIRAMPGEAAQTPIIAITADVFANEDDRLLELGFTDCLFKPLDEDRLERLINTYIASLPVVTAAKAEPVQGIIENLPEEMIERLFASLYANYAELARTFKNKEFSQAREAAHKVLGLVCYFKVGSLADDIRKLQEAIKQDDHATASELLNASLLQIRTIEKVWRTSKPT